MGNTSSTVSSIDIITNSVSEYFKKKSSACVASQSAVNAILLKGTSGNVVIDGIDQRSDQYLNFSCFISETNQLDFQNELVSKVENELKSKVSGIQGNLFTKQAQNSKIKQITEITSSIKLEEILNCIGTQLASNIIEIEGEGDVTIKNVSQSNFQKSIVDCKLLSSEQIKSLTSLDNSLKQSLVMENTGISMNMILAVVAVIVIYYLFFSKSDK